MSDRYNQWLTEEIRNVFDADLRAAPIAEGLDDIRRDIRAAQVQIAEATWRLGRDHPEFHTLQRALSRLNRASRPSDERVPEEAE